jgi:drug/metabolite transporter (DMT)-like permease
MSAMDERAGAATPPLPAAAALQAGAQRRLGMVLIASAALMWSTAGLFSRALSIDLWTMQWGRAGFGALFLIAVGLWELRHRSVLREIAALGPAGWAMVPLSALGMFGYVAGLQLTTVANVMIVYATTPFVTAALAWLWLGERVTRRTVLASALAVTGVVVMVVGSPAGADLLGSLMIFMMVVCFAAIICLARKLPTVSMTPVNALAAILCSAACFPLATPSSLTLTDAVVLAGFGFVTLCLALLLFMRGARYVPSAEAGLISLLDTVVAPILVWVVFAERPSGAALLGGFIVLCAVLWHMVGRLREERPAR